MIFAQSTTQHNLAHFLIPSMSLDKYSSFPFISPIHSSFLCMTPQQCPYLSPRLARGRVWGEEGLEREKECAQSQPSFVWEQRKALEGMPSGVTLGSLEPLFDRQRMKLLAIHHSPAPSPPLMASPVLVAAGDGGESDGLRQCSRSTTAPLTE